MSSQNAETLNGMSDSKCSISSPEAIKPVVVRFDFFLVSPSPIRFLPEIMGYSASTSQQEVGKQGIGHNSEPTPKQYTLNPQIPLPATLNPKP